MRALLTEAQITASRERTAKLEKFAAGAGIAFDATDHELVDALEVIAERRDALDEGRANAHQQNLNRLATGNSFSGPAFTPKGEKPFGSAAPAKAKAGQAAPDMGDKVVAIMLARRGGKK